MSTKPYRAAGVLGTMGGLTAGGLATLAYANTRDGGLQNNWGKILAATGAGAAAGAGLGVSVHGLDMKIIRQDLEAKGLEPTEQNIIEVLKRGRERGQQPHEAAAAMARNRKRKSKSTSNRSNIKSRKASSNKSVKVGYRQRKLYVGKSGGKYYIKGKTPAGKPRRVYVK